MTRGLLALLLCCAAATAQDRAVFRNGDVKEGSIELDAAHRTARCGKESWPAVELCLVEKEDGTLIWAPSFSWRLQGYRLLVRDRSRGDLEKLLRRAIRIRDAKLARRLFDLASAAGMSGRKTASLLGRVKYLESGHSVAFSSKDVEQIRGGLAALESAVPRLLVDRAQVSLKGDPVSALRLLRVALKTAPECPEALSFLAKLAPKDFPLGDARIWLDWRLEVESRGARQASPDQPTLRRIRRMWRRDVYGVRCGPLLLITPVRDMTTVGRCLACGRIATGLLGTLFPATKDAKAPKVPMNVLLYPDKASYQASHGKDNAEAAFLKWTTGYYAPDERLSRFYWHKERDAERRIVGTCVHELTHQWLDEQNPLCHGRFVRHDVHTPAFWIVEGFATFLEEGEYDLDKGTWELFDPRSHTLDTVHALGAKEALIPWGKFYRMNQLDFIALNPVPSVRFVLRWHLGYTENSVKRTFYDQAGATCQYLYNAEGGRYRQALLDYVVAYYAGKSDKLGIETAFGMSPETLGVRVEVFAEDVESGKFPPK